MEFLIIVLALALHWVIPDLRWLHRDNWLFVWLGKWGDQPLSVFKFILSMVLPVVVLWLLSCGVGHWWGSLGLFVFGLLVLLYSLGRGNLPASLHNLEEHVARDDQQAVYHDAVQINNGDSGTVEPGVTAVEQTVDSGESLHHQLLQSLSYRFFENSFPVIFWFFVLGIPGALLYRISELSANRRCNLQEGDAQGSDDRSNDESANDDSANAACPVQTVAGRWLWLMEWIPVRLLGFTFALVGNFACCIHHWKECVLCPVRTTGQILLHYVVGALSADADTAHIDVAELEMVHQLFHRALLLWVCVIALLAVF